MSSAGGSFTIEPDQSEDIGRGSKIILYMKEDQLEYLVCMQPPFPLCSAQWVIGSICLLMRLFACLDLPPS